MISRTRSDRLHKRFLMQSGFALPTLLVSAIIMLIVLLSAGTAATTLRTSLDEQHYNALAREAAESGHARAEACLRSSGYVATWSDSTRLRPDTNCSGITVSGGQKYITQTDNMRTTFVVWAPVIGTSSSAKVTVVGTTELFRTSTQSTYQVYSQTVVRQSSYTASPKMAGGAGWKGAGHLAAILTTDQKLYGFGSNVGGQINNDATPSIVPTPVPITLPDGVSNAVDVVTSGQGASIICILANTGDVWCRGVPGAAENGLMPLSTGWKEFVLPNGLTAVSMSISGYGPDAMCVLASDSQAYCAGENYYGSLGTNDLTYSISKLDSPQKFRLDIPAPGALLRKIYTMGDITCGITTTNDMYCAGLNWTGQIGGPSTTGTGNGVYATPIRYPIPGARKVDNVAVTYHMMDGHPLVHVLATDGTIWSSGNYQFGDAGNGSTSGNTGSSQAPALFTSVTSGGVMNKSYATGSEMWNAQSGRCIDNAGNSSTNGNVIQLYDCNSSVAQTWVYGKDKQITNLGTGKCLDVPNNSLNPGAFLQLYDCNNSAAQQFDLVGTNTIKHAASGLCLDAINNGTANGTRIETWTCYGNGAQSFTRWSGFSGWRGMIVGVNHFCAIRSDAWSGMWCAGRNNYGQLANWATTTGNFYGQCVDAPTASDSIFNVNLPNGEKVDYSKLTDEWTNQYFSTMVISTSGKVYGSGRNEFGKLGNGSLGDPANNFRECVVKEFVLPTGVTAVDMSTRDEFTTYVLGSDGRIYAAGQNNLGQVGDGTTAHRSTPVEVKIPRQANLY